MGIKFIIPILLKSMKKLLFLYIFLIIPKIFWSQSTLTEKVDGLIEQAESYTYNNIDSALHYNHLALDLIKNTDAQSPLNFNVYRSLGYVYEENNRYPEAIKEYEKALKIAENKLPLSQKLEIYNDWALIHKKMGQYDVTHDYHLLTIQEAEKSGNYEMCEIGYNGLGTMYALVNDYDKAILYYHKSIEAAEKWGNKAGVVLTNQNISELYLDSKHLDMALQSIAKTYDLAVISGDSIRLGAVLTIYGKIETALGKLDQASLKFQKAQAIFEKHGEKPRLADLFLSVGNIYFQQKKYIETQQYFQKCLSLEPYFTPAFAANFYHKQGQLYAAQGLNDKALAVLNKSLLQAENLGLNDISKEVHLELSKVLNILGKYNEAYKHLLDANKLSEKLFDEALKKNMNESKLKLDIQKLDLQIEAQKKALEQSFWTRLILGLFSVILLGLLYYTWRQMKAKQKAQLSAELMMKELHHRVKNNLQTITSIMRLQARNINDPSVSLVLSESRSRLEAISMIHQQLYRNEGVQTVNFKQFLEDLIEKLRFAYNFNHKPFDVSINLENDYWDVDMAMPLGLIINELLTNSFKYAYSSSQVVIKPHLTININSTELYYADNGNGLPETFSVDTTNTFGIQLITSMAHQLMAKYSFGNNDGMYFKLLFKK
jgi:two-component system, sensor histidine kinase PdtaS